jgi:YHS domain-containing protein
MTKTYLISALAGAALLGSTGLALAATGEFDNMSAMDLANGTMVHTTCEISANFGGKTYCFKTESEMHEFMSRPRHYAAMARKHYAKMAH